ncbi:ROK family protein [Faecalicatena acetigenes]|uniref:ROK family protein n=1 Tax=Faecalicatena acetigenes TaxID=2981790 RepID=A0ABT2TF72_9FIRM|nr:MULTISPECIES: ROK family protein [Lachnospiraceae]MCU6748436.1 ROK family protein [Faecalicatena acetigenes]SCI44261.1 Glucokinase [uncultured Clostridium sp.]
MKTFIGVDLGGTNVRAAVVKEDGTILCMNKDESHPEKGAEAVMKTMISLIKGLDGYENCKGIGMGIPGPIDTVHGKIIVSTNLPKLIGFPIVDYMKDYFRKPVRIDNDVKAAALGEAVLGSGKGYPIVYYVTISTGIGGALVIDRKVVSGQNGHAGEIGNICIDRNRKKYNILNVGAVENEASGTALTRKGRELFSDTIFDAGDVFELARAGNERAIKLVDEMAYDLAMMFCAVGHVIDPHVFVVGGGVMKGKDVFFEKMERYYRSMIHEGMQKVVFKEALLEEPGIVGAAMLVREL